MGHDALLKTVLKEGYNEGKVLTETIEIAGRIFYRSDAIQDTQ